MHCHCCEHRIVGEINIPVFYSPVVHWDTNLPFSLRSKKIEPAESLKFVGLRCDEINKIQEALSVLMKYNVKFFQEKP